MNNIEHQIQSEAFKTIRLLGKNDPFYATIHAIPNGGKRSIGTAVKLKAEGVLSGVPDIFVPAARLYIEVKAPGGKLTVDQAKFLISATESNYGIAVCFSSVEILDTINSYRKNNFPFICAKHDTAIILCDVAILKHKKSLERKVAKQGAAK